MFNRTSLHIAMLVWGCIFSLIAALCMFMSRNFDKEKRRWMIAMQLVCAILMLCDALAWGYRGVEGARTFLVLYFSNFLVFALSDVLLGLYHGYLCCCLFRDFSRQKLQKPVWRIRLGYGISVAALLLVIISQITHWYYSFDSHNFYHRNSGYILSLVMPMLGMLLDVSLLIQYRKRLNHMMFSALLSYVVLPFLATVALAFYYGISLSNIAIFISMILMFVASMMEQNENLARKEKEAADMRISVMMSQIAPHFIYNTLNSIAGLCESNPAEAKETTLAFSEYLRGNLNALSENDLIPFERELKHVTYYLTIEQKRFGARVKVCYDIQEQDFLLPALTLQPIVENAVKHGLCKKKGGGTVIIRTERQEGRICMTVVDDGAGFDDDRTGKTSDGKLHVGIENVRTRLRDMCQGELLIESTKGVGTTVRILIPDSHTKREKE
ncbi:histidine kinase [Eubacterium sp. MSJ-21]|nr:histidine kinase [Eubacterium sp. MSJ-21]